MFQPKKPNENLLKSVLEAFEMVSRLFPFKQEEDLKVYAILSVRKEIANLINLDSCLLTLTGAYSLDEALRINKEFLVNQHPQHHKDWWAGIMTTSMAYQQLVPIHKISEMVDKISEERQGKPVDKKVKGVEEMEAYVKYIIDTAEATAWEKGIVTGIMKRFREKIIKT